MVRKIQQLRGLEANLPILAEGQIAFTTDTKKMFIGSNSGNIEITRNSSTQAFNVKDFGVKGDGVTDDTLSMQSAIDYVHSIGGGVIELPSGSIKINNITLKEKVQMVGVTNKSTTILAIDTPCITMESNTTIKDISLMGIGETLIGDFQGGIRLLTGSGQIIDSCYFRNLYTCIYNSGASKLLVKDSTFDCDGYYGLYSEVTHNSTIEGNIFNSNLEETRPVCFQFATHNCIIQDNNIFGNGLAITGILFMNHYDNYNASTFGNRVINNYVSGVTEEGISVDMMMQSDKNEILWTGGTVTSANTNTLSDSSKSWSSGEWYYRYILITKGKGVGQLRLITGNSGTLINIDKPWNVIPDSTSTYLVGNFGFDNVISHNYVEDCGRQGILLYGTNLRSQIINNIVMNCGINPDTTVYEWSNIGVVSCEANEINRFRPSLYNIVSDNTISQGKIGIFIGSAPWSGQYTPIMLPSNIIVEGNTIQETTTGIYARECINSIIRSNSISNSTNSIGLDVRTSKVECFDNILEISIVNLGTDNITEKTGGGDLTSANIISALGYTPTKASDITWANVLSKPTTFTPSTHTHLWADITNKPTTFTPTSHTHLWVDITDKPATFAPSAHTHSYNDLTNKPTIISTVATTTANGLMSNTDKSKLDGIATGANNYSLPTASNTVLGGVRAGTNITNSSGTISVADATISAKGVVQLTNSVTSTSTTTASTPSAVKIVNDNLTTHTTTKATTSQLGHVKPDGTTITVNSDGVISAVGGGTVDLTAHETSDAPHVYGGKFEWRYNPTTNSLDLVVLD